MRSGCKVEEVELCQVLGVQPVLSRRWGGVMVTPFRPPVPPHVPKETPSVGGQRANLLIGTF